MAPFYLMGGATCGAGVIFTNHNFLDGNHTVNFITINVTKCRNEGGSEKRVLTPFYCQKNQNRQANMESFLPNGPSYETRE
jgi:hypothetical protein